MKNKYVTPDLEVIGAEASTALNVSTGDIDVNVGDGFF